MIRRPRLPAPLSPSWRCCSALAWRARHLPAKRSRRSPCNVRISNAMRNRSIMAASWPAHRSLRGSCPRSSRRYRFFTARSRRQQDRNTGWLRARSGPSRRLRAGSEFPQPTQVSMENDDEKILCNRRSGDDVEHRRLRRRARRRDQAGCFVLLGPGRLLRSGDGLLRLSRRPS